jgi:hypothetical protein
MYFNKKLSFFHVSSVLKFLYHCALHTPNMFDQWQIREFTKQVFTVFYQHGSWLSAYRLKLNYCAGSICWVLSPKSHGEHLMFNELLQKLNRGLAFIDHWSYN